MVKILQVIFSVVFVCFFLSVQGQNTFVAVQSGNWNNGATWGNASPGTIGVDFPGPNDDAFTNGFSITVPIGTWQCRDLYVDNATPNGIVLQFSVISILVVNGTLYSHDSTIPSVFPPMTSGLISGPGTLRFTGSNFGNASGVLQTGDEVIFFWGSIASLGRVEFNLGSNTGTISQLYTPAFATDNFSCSNFILNSGTLTIDEFTVAGLNVASQIVVGNGATLNLPVPATQDGLSSSRIGTANITGTLNLTTSSAYINAATFNLNAGANLNINFDDPAIQTHGWWHTTNAPTTATLNATSTVRYLSSNDQNVFARTYGNLVLEGGGNKTVPNSGALNVTGSLTINSPSINFITLNAQGISIGGSLLNQGTWSPQQLITFESSSTATIGGSQSITFAGGITVNKPGGTLTMATATNINTNISNGIAITAGTLSLGNVNTTLTGGNVSVDAGAILTSGASGTLRIQGTSQLSGDGTYNLTNLEVLSGGDCTINSDISIRGNLTNNGSLSFSSAIDVTFNGSGAQTISGNPFSIFDMTVNKSGSTLFNNTDLTLVGTLTMTTGTFDADGPSGTGNFILYSDANGDARIGPMAGGVIEGNVTFQRYFNSTVVDRYRNFSFPVGGVTVNDLRAFFTIRNGSFAWYDESVLGDYDQGWQIQNNGPLNPARAYTAGMYNTGPITISLRGPLLVNQSSSESPYNYNISYTDDPAQPADQDGWNFVVNPYASPIDWNAATGWTKNGGVDAVAAVWDAVNGQYQYTNMNWNGIVASGQSFWVHTTAAGELRSTEDVKVDVANPAFYRMKTIDEPDRLLVKLENDKHQDVTIIQYKEKATPEYDGAYDAFKLPNQIFNLSTLSPEGANLAINVLPRSFCTNQLRLNIANIEPGSYKLSFDGLSSFVGLDSLVLYDKFLKRAVRVSDETVYNFDVTASAESYGAGRFELLFSYGDLTPFTAEIAMDGRKLVSNAPTGNQWMLNGEILPDETDNVLIPTASGEYQVMVSDGICTSKSEVFRLEQLRSRVHPNPATTHFIVDLTDVTNDDLTKSGDVYLYSVTGQLILKEPFTTTGTELSVKLEGIAAGEYIVNLVVGDSKIVAKERLVVK